MHLTWPLTGRSAEAEYIQAAVSAAELSGLVVSGAAGVGKTRVVRDALLAAAQEHDVRWVVATSSAQSLPLGALAAWAPSEAGDTLALVRGVVEALTCSTGKRVVVAVDDAHLLDDMSAFVLHQIVQRRAATVVVTVREGEPISTALGEVLGAGQFDRLDLQPLSREETVTLATAALGGPTEPHTAERLWKLTRGNALYLRNIVEQEVSDGRLMRQRGYWRWEGEPVVSPGLVHTIESRIGTLVGPVGDVVDALAVGEPLELASLRTITSPEAVEEAESRGLIALEQSGLGVQVRIAHPLYGEVRRRRAAATRLRRLRGLVAAELATRDDRDDVGVVVRRATLSLDSDTMPDAALFLRAAQGALSFADLNLAERLAAVATRSGAPPEAAFIRAHALGWLARGQEADEVLAAVDATTLSDDQRARLAFLRASNRLFALADPQGAKSLIDAAASHTPADSRGCIDAFLTVYWAVMGKPRLATESSKRIVLEQLPDILGAETAGAIAVAAGLAGRAEEAAAMAGAGYNLVNRTFDAFHMRFWIADAHINALVLSGRIAEAARSAEELHEQSVDLPGAAPLLADAAAGRAALYSGDLATASTVLRRVVELLLSGETSHMAYRHRLPLAFALGMQGLTQQAAAVLAALDEGHDPVERQVDYERELAKAWLAAGQGAITPAIAAALSVAETAGADGQFAAEVICLQTAAQFGDSSCATRLRELAGIVEGPRAGLAARLATGIGDADPTELVSVSDDFELIGDIVAAADAAAHAAIIYRQQDLRGSALGCSARAQALAGRCGASTPALRQAVEPVPLTGREREVVTLLGEGMSNRAVAERLTLSVRTVESHIYRAMARTGATTREELVALIPQRRPEAPGAAVQ